MEGQSDIAEQLTFTRGAVAVIGGTGGLGSAICRAFAQAGARLFFSYRSNSSKASQLLGELEAAGAKAEMRQVDLGDSDAVRDFLQAARAECGGVQAVIYASGPVVRFKPTVDFEELEIEDALRSDAISFFRVAKAAIPLLRETRGSLVALSTSATKRVPALDLMSAVPKAAIEMMVQTIAREEGRNNVRANCIGVGQIMAGQGISMQEDPKGRKMAARAAEAAPLRRQGESFEIANAALFLASDMSSFITGQTLYVDGGVSL
jgi:NAD(P)-dependent dehydrogenase (short-subunit alcohol dehydrogenase family)